MVYAEVMLGKCVNWTMMTAHSRSHIIRETIDIPSNVDWNGGLPKRLFTLTGSSIKWSHFSVKDNQLLIILSRNLLGSLTQLVSINNLSMHMPCHPPGLAKMIPTLTPALPPLQIPIALPHGWSQLAFYRPWLLVPSPEVGPPNRYQVHAFLCLLCELVEWVGHNLLWLGGWGLRGT